MPLRCCGTAWFKNNFSSQCRRVLYFSKDSRNFPVYCMCVFTFLYFLCAHSMLFGIKYTFCFFFLFCFVFFCTSPTSFCNFFIFYITILLISLYCQKYSTHTKVLYLNSIHSSMYIGMHFHLYIFFTMFCVHSFFCFLFIMPI